MYSVKNVFLKVLQNSQENICARVSFLMKMQAEACNFIKKETLAQVISCKFCEIFKNTFSYRIQLNSCNSNSYNSKNHLNQTDCLLPWTIFCHLIRISIQKIRFPLLSRMMLRLTESRRYHVRIF